MNEQMFLESMNHLKEINDKRDSEMKKLERQLLEYKKQLITVYGIIRLLDSVYNNHVIEPAFEVTTIIECLRTYISEYLVENVINNNSNSNYDSSDDAD
tara:strand:+ start:2587 stop:2883 length:297 start_codon:yes stop_codon:yes gene_type:complete